jgi:hypothetical protein
LIRPRRRAWKILGPIVAGTSGTKQQVYGDPRPAELHRFLRGHRSQLVFNPV